jgi:hypothetical protein
MQQIITAKLKLTTTPEQLQHYAKRNWSIVMLSTR